jgi:hypothetical protein
LTTNPITASLVDYNNEVGFEISARVPAYRDRL